MMRNIQDQTIYKEYSQLLIPNGTRNENEQEWSRIVLKRYRQFILGVRLARGYMMSLGLVETWRPVKE